MGVITAKGGTTSYYFKGAITFSLRVFLDWIDFPLKN